MKRILILILSIFPIIGMHAYSSFEYNGLSYDIIGDGSVSVTGYSGSSCRYSHLSIPSSVLYNGSYYSVTNIGSCAFEECWGLKSVSVGDSVTSIGELAFAYCFELTSINIPNSVTSIGSSAFQGCSDLTSITIPDGVTSIGVCVFQYCCSLTSITIPNGVTSIGVGAFGNCNSLTSITLPNGVTSIGSSAFQGCSDLTSITIPNGVTSIGSSAFQGCSDLTSITIPNGVTSIGSSAFQGCSDLTSITIPNGVTSIGSSAFQGCSDLTSITIPNGVTSIGSSAFQGCSDLTSITIPNGVTSIGSSVFQGCSGLTSITIPNHVTSIDQSAFKDCTGLTSIVWNVKNNTDFTDSPFADSKEKITLFTFGEAVERIPANLCYKMSKLTSVTIPYSVTSIGNYAFSGCTGLTSITIPESVTSIGESAFYGCKNIETIVFGSGIETIGSNAFANCQSIYEMTIYATKVPNISENTFSGVSERTTLYVPKGCAKKYKAHSYWGIFTIEEIVQKYTVSLYCSPEQGVVSGGGEYEENAVATLTAVAHSDYHFVRWSDGNINNPRTIIVTSDTTLLAEFAVNTYTVSVSCDATRGSISGAGIYPVNTDVTLTAIPNKGYEFVQWSNGVTANPYTFRLTQDTSLECIFQQATAIDNTEIDSTPQKFIRNGQVLILREGKTYTTLGVAVE